MTAENPERSSDEHEVEDTENAGGLTRKVLEKIHETDTRTEPKSEVLQKRLVYYRKGDANGHPMRSDNHVTEQPGSKISKKRLMNNRPGDENGRPTETHLSSERKFQNLQKRPIYDTAQYAISHLSDSVIGREKDRHILQKRLVYNRGDTNGLDTQDPMDIATNGVSPKLKALLSLRDRVKRLHENIDNTIASYTSSEKNPSPSRILSSFREGKKIPPEFPPQMGDFRASYTEGKAATEQDVFDWLKQGHQVPKDLSVSRLTSNDESAEHNVGEGRLQTHQWEKMQDVELPKIGETSLKKAINVDIKRQPLKVQTDNRVGDRDAMKQPLDTFIHTA